MSDKNEWKQFSLVVGIAIVVLVILLAFILIKPYPFDLQEKSVSFYSSEFPIEAGLQQLAAKTDFLVAVQIVESGVVNQYLNNSLNLFSVVLIGNQKKAIGLWMVTSVDGSLLSCHTNLGDVRTDQELSAEECLSFINDFDAPVFRVFLPDSSLGKAQVLVSSKGIELRPSNVNDLGIATISALNKMYSNSGDIIAAVNQIAGGIRG